MSFCKCGLNHFLTKREDKGLSARIKEFNLKSPVFHMTLLPDELIETGLPDDACAAGSRIRSTIVAGRGAVQFHREAIGFASLRWA